MSSSEKNVQKKSGTAFQSLKGMREITGEEYYKFQGFFEKAQEVSEYYGFKPIETPILESEDLFVLEDTEEKLVVGSGLIMAKHGTDEIPHNFFKILTLKNFLKKFLKKLGLQVF